MEMEMVNVSQRKTKSQRDKMLLEDYLLLIQSRSHLHLTVTHLNQVLLLLRLNSIVTVFYYYFQISTNCSPNSGPADHQHARIQENSQSSQGKINSGLLSLSLCLVPVKIESLAQFVV